MTEQELKEKARQLGNQPAFPTIEFSQSMVDCPFDSRTSLGLTKRQYFAGLAMQGCVVQEHQISIPDLAEFAVKCTDALLLELAKGEALSTEDFKEVVYE